MSSPKDPRDALHPILDHSQEHELRMKKRDTLANSGIDAWPAAQQVPNTCTEVVTAIKAEKAAEQYTVAGRLMTRREHGKTAFATIQDRSGRLQIYLKKETLGDTLFEQFLHLIDLGDILLCSGTPFITKTGEPTLSLTSFALLSKCLHPLPEKFHGITDIETKYRHRYLDLMTSAETRERFIKRSRIIRSMRHYLDAHDFIEVETPMLHPIPGGAAARPFSTHHNALNSDFYLRIAPELYLKRLVVGGLERVYEINRNFRNEGVSTRHNPEFTMLEFYLAHGEYQYIMNFVEELLRALAKEVAGTLQVPYGELTIDFEKPFARMSMEDAIVEYGKIDRQQLTPDAIDATCTQHGADVPPGAGHGRKIMAMFEAVAEKKIVNPTYIINFPVEVSPLAKRDPKNPEVAARFELFIAGMELANGFNELNDPFDQAERFRDQVRAHAAGDAEAMHYDADYIYALEYGLPPTVGVGIGIDRLTMVLTNTTSIKEVILFPTLKRKDV